MRVVCDKGELQRGLAIVKGAVPSRTTLEALRNVLASTDGGRLKLTATDLSVTVTTWLDARIEREGSALLPFPMFYDYVRTLGDGDVSLNYDGRRSVNPRVALSAARTDSSFNCMTAADYPQPPESSDEPVALSIDPSDLRKALGRVVFSASGESARPALGCVLMEFEGDGFTFVAADGFRMSMQQGSLLEPLDTGALRHSEKGRLSVLVPRAAASQLARHCRKGGEPVIVRVDAGRKHARFCAGDVELVVVLGVGPYVNYRAFQTPEASTRVELDAEALSAANRSMAVFNTTDGDTLTQFVVDAEREQVALRSARGDGGHSGGSVRAQVTGKADRITFSPRFLDEMLRVIGAGPVVLEMAGPTAPGVFRPAGAGSDDTFTHVLMPMLVGTTP